jgi:hypothetical protein
MVNLKAKPPVAMDRRFQDSVNGGTVVVTEPFDLVFEEQLTALQFTEPHLIGSGMGKLRFDFTLQCLMLPFEAGQGHLKGHGFISPL